ncbi:MAG: fructosamine kinase family protein [Wenzhouxiangella sp.]|nr:MAG: fructosamine kinase family protein [Wenzhouxiangella sp.]
MTLHANTARRIASQLGLETDRLNSRPVGGGSIAEAVELVAGSTRTFVKTVPAGKAGVLAAECDGLGALAAAGAVRVPAVLGHGEVHGLAWLALEYLDLKARGAVTDAALGHELANLHRASGPAFGWHSDNYIGLTPQANAFGEDWCRFFRDQRLASQLALLRRRHPEACADIDAVLRSWERRAGSHRPPASLLHGDLWSGNAAGLPDGQPVIYDPAVHYGDRECDLAMAAMFGGFSPAFFRAYDSAWPLPDGWQERRRWYQLYHLLNHANLFGGSYARQVKQELNRL